MDWADEQAKEVFDSLECTFQDAADDSQAARDVATIAAALRAERERAAKILARLEKCEAAIQLSLEHFGDPLKCLRAALDLEGR